MKLLMRVMGIVVTLETLYDCSASRRASSRSSQQSQQCDVTVPVSHEEVRVVREPTRGEGAGTFADDEAEVVLHREEPVVQKRGSDQLSGLSSGAAG